MSRILDNEAFVLQLQEWATTRLGWIRRNEKWNFTEEDWEEIAGEIRLSLWKNVDSIREFAKDKPYFDAVIGFVNNIVSLAVSGYGKWLSRDKRVIWQKEVRFEDLKERVKQAYGGWWEWESIEALGFDPENEMFVKFVLLPKLREMLVWVGGLDFYEYYVEGIGEEPTGEHRKRVRRRMKKHWVQ